MIAARSFPERHWYRRSPLSWLLLPLSLAFGAIVAVRRAAVGLGLYRPVRLPVPVVVIGNLTVGGSGKTPLVLWLVAALRKRGFTPGIVSRGYGRAAAAPAEVRETARVDDVGDEPLLLAQRSGTPVLVGADRVAAGTALLAAHPGCDVIVCDDGLQHYRLARDVEIAVEDDRGHGNGFLLPAGPLREPGSRRVDFTVLNEAPSRPGTFAMRLVPGGFRSVTEPARRVGAEAFAGKRLHAVAGIGNPERFFRTLRALALDFTPHPFPDHHRYRPEDLVFADCDAVLMTEKDAVKCAAFGRDDLYALCVEAQVDDRLAELIASRLHGPAPARHSGRSD